MPASATTAAVSTALPPLAPGPILAVSIRHCEQGGDPVAVADLPARPFHGAMLAPRSDKPAARRAGGLSSDRTSTSGDGFGLDAGENSLYSVKGGPSARRRAGRAAWRPVPARTAESTHGIREGHRTTRSGALPPNGQFSTAADPTLHCPARLRAASRARCVTT